MWSLTYLLNLSRHYDGDVDAMWNSLFAYFRACCNSPTTACASFILFYFTADVRTCAMNAAIYFTAAYISFHCTWNHSLRWNGFADHSAYMDKLLSPWLSNMRLQIIVKIVTLIFCVDNNNLCAANSISTTITVETHISVSIKFLRY